MGAIDWVIVILYIAGIVWLGFYLGKEQEGEKDYYLAGKGMKPWQVALSMVSTQISAISLIGAPAFVALKRGGGLFWLQYELAVPLSMIAILLFLVPAYHREHVVTIYELLERRFDRKVRKSISLIFLLSRGLGTGVALLATSVVTAVCLSIPLAYTILLVGTVTIIYTTMGGIKADIYSDIIQLFVFVGGILFAIGVVVIFFLKTGTHIEFPDPSRLEVFKIKEVGLRDGETFGFWPMLLGGFFLYFSYYGCDQSQAQRILTTATPEQAQKALVINGLLRFPITLIYIVFGLMLIPFIASHPHFYKFLQGKPADFLVPQFIVQFFPMGLRGIMVSGIFAATMSSVDSALNSLSAATWVDFLQPVLGRRIKNKMLVLRGLTVFWGIFAIVSSFYFMGGAETVIELVNKIGSAFYGPVLAVFAMAVFLRGIKGTAVLTGLSAGVVTNLILWCFFQRQVSWMWWNFTGFGVPVLFVLLYSLLAEEKISFVRIPIPKKAAGYARALLFAFPIFVAVSYVLEKVL